MAQHAFLKIQRADANQNFALVKTFERNLDDDEEALGSVQGAHISLRPILKRSVGFD